MEEHTPGPWHLHETRGLDTSYEVHAEYENGALGKKHHFVAAIADMTGAERFGNIGTPLDNARLIAAAPDLLKACEKMQQLIEEKLLIENTEDPAHITGIFCADLITAIENATKGSPHA